MTVKTMLLNIYIVCLLGAVSVCFGIISPLFIIFNIVFRSGTISSAVRHLIRLYGLVLVRLSALFVSVEVDNKAGSLPLPVVFVANHCSAIDPYLFGLIACENAFITSWPFKIPVQNLVMRMAGYIDARCGWDEIERQGRGLLEKGCSVTIWPEGHRSRD
ncbi:MAG: 1-acyl-sn-glycerol-3-phosphate acyltransferase, partial [Desulfobulbaceae bacterium]|nr:1-acyl-sn-glycerol-3-phosphate acyltransferase [Desulfobulbaceae bacterium]